MNYVIDCELSNPVNLAIPPKEDFEYQILTCEATSTGGLFVTTTSETTELIENASTGATFYISKTINYGEFIIITFLTLFLIFSIAKFLIDFIIPKFISFKK